MNLEQIIGFTQGFITAIPLASLVEGGPVHKWALHGKKVTEEELAKMNPIKRKVMRVKENMRRGHAEHHKYYGTGRDPDNSYYQTPANQDKVSHFSHADQALITTGAITVGLGLNKLAELTLNVPEEQAVSRVAGFTAGVLTYYVLYETTHQLMHILEGERIQVGQRLQENLQQSYPIESLKLSKPLLDDIRTYVLSSKVNEERVKTLANELQTQLKDQIPDSSQSFAEYHIHALKGEFLHYKPSSFFSWFKGKVRDSNLFRLMDDHHFVHHYQQSKNLNVILPFYDLIRGTKVPSDRKALSDKNYWITMPTPIK